MMPANPLSWPAGPFLSLYVAFVAAALVGIFLFRFWLFFTAPAAPPPPPDVLQLAWLSGGRRKVADTVLVALFEAGAAVTGGKRDEIHVNPVGASLPWEFQSFLRHIGGQTTRARFLKQVTPRLDEIEDELVREGLIPPPRQILWLKTTTWILLAVPLVMGGLKIGAGLARARPVGLLTGLEIVTFIVTLLLSAFPPARTLTGLRAFRASRRENRRIRRAPGSWEMAMAFALAGPAVLAGTDYGRAMGLSRFARGSSGAGRDGDSGDGGGGGGRGGSSNG
jgi:uncharacterized protein (TIGR04222 family)